MRSWLGVFQIGVFLRVALSELRCIFVLGPSSSLFNSFFSFLLWSMFPYFTPKLFCFPRIRLWVCLRTFLPYFLVEFSFVVFECLVLSALFDLSSFANTLWFIFTSCIICTYHVALLFPSNHIRAFFFWHRLLDRHRSFLISVSSLNSHPGFEHMFIFLVMGGSGYFVQICVNNLFIFSIFTLTIFQPWFTIEGNVVFFSDIIFFIDFTFIFSPWVSDWSIFGFVVFWL